MKVELTVHLLDFLAEQGYKYLLLQPNQNSSPGDIERFNFISVKNFENITSYYSGSSSCFFLDAEPRVMAEGVAGKVFYVIVDEQEAVEYSRYLLNAAINS
ncbi:hypothetical protein [Desertivirga arenae]|uniref:hypothetical protein n=1 Tax=Desertivirga arenae TaxID=2810309 RepID=UPI001A974578|nr:hypothetical protein [Pedobacter sp. SYSU D00823]